MNNKFYIQQLKKFKGIFSAYPSVENLVEQLYLKAILESYPRIKAIPNINTYTENQIRNEFVRDFKNSNSLLKDFIQNKTIVLTAENQVYTASLVQRTDIELISSSHSHKFVIECKRLSSAESRYIHGRTINGKYEIDGMEKFIELIYSVGDNEAAMLSFVIKSSTQNTTDTLQAKVEKFHAASDMVQFINKRCLTLTTSFQSRHVRVNSTSIQLYHLFLDFT